MNTTEVVVSQGGSDVVEVTVGIEVVDDGSTDVVEKVELDNDNFEMVEELLLVVAYGCAPAHVARWGSQRPSTRSQTRNARIRRKRSINIRS